jgi:hypothetical protein
MNAADDNDNYDSVGNNDNAGRIGDDNGGNNNNDGGNNTNKSTTTMSAALEKAAQY